PAYDVFDAWRRSGIGQTQNVTRMGLNLAVPGECYLIGYPPPRETVLGEEVYTGNLLEDREVSLDTLIWIVASTSEVTVDTDGVITINPGEPGNEMPSPTDSAFVIRVWRPPPQYWWQAESPAKASLPILRELVGLTMHISAQIDSRLAGAGVFIVPAS